MADLALQSKKILPDRPTFYDQSGSEFPTGKLAPYGKFVQSGFEQLETSTLGSIESTNALNYNSDLFNISKVKKIDELNKFQSLKNIDDNKNFGSFTLGQQISSHFSLLNDGEGATSIAKEATNAFEFDSTPLAAAGAMISDKVFGTLSDKAYSLGTSSGRIQAENLKTIGSDTSTGIMAGALVGSLGGPLGTLAGAAIGGTIGGVVGHETAPQMYTTGGSMSASNNNLPF